MKVTATNGKINFTINATIRDDIMKLESTEKTKAFGVPVYMKQYHDSNISKCYGANGWAVIINK